MIQMYDLEGNEIKLRGFKGLRLVIPSPSFDRPDEDENSTYKKRLPRELEAEFYYKGEDYIDSLLLRDEVYKQIAGDEFYIAESNLPYKWWKVRFSESFTPERMNHRMQSFTISLTAPKGVAESKGSTLTPLEFTADSWQIGQGLEFDEFKYEFNTPTFRVYNAGDVTIDPRKYPLEIIYRGMSTNLEIKNTTTGDTWKYNGSTSDVENIFLRGVRSLKNGNSIFADTNHKLITLAPGWNDFTLSGTTGPFLIGFDHKFYYN